MALAKDFLKSLAGSMPAQVRILGEIMTLRMVSGILKGENETLRTRIDTLTRTMRKAVTQRDGARAALNSERDAHVKLDNEWIAERREHQDKIATLGAMLRKAEAALMSDTDRRALFASIAAKAANATEASHAILDLVHNALNGDGDESVMDAAIRVRNERNQAMSARVSILSEYRVLEQKVAALRAALAESLGAWERLSPTIDKARRDSIQPLLVDEVIYHDVLVPGSVGKIEATIGFVAHTDPTKVAKEVAKEIAANVKPENGHGAADGHGGEDYPDYRTGRQ